MAETEQRTVPGGAYESRDVLEAGLEQIRRAPSDRGTVELIVVRPAVDERAVVAEASIDLVDGVIGDNWRTRGNHRTFDGSADPLAQVTLVSSRVAAAIAGPHDRWQLSGDQLFVDLDLSRANLPAGTRLAVGSAVLEVTPKPHRGCDKFRARFGTDALRFVNSEVGRELNLRGVNSAVVVAGTVRAGDVIRKLLP